MKGWKINIIVLLLACGFAFGCDTKPSFVVASFEVDQTSWDSLFVRVDFASVNRLSVATPVIPETRVYTVFGSNFDTLYVGDQPSIPIPDRQLEHREALRVEVCAHFEGQSACDQRIVYASPKKVGADYVVDFPLDPPAFQKGFIELASTLYRQIYGTEDWELIRKPSGKPLSVVVYGEGAPTDYVRIPINRSETTFDLSRFEGYRNVRYQIQSALMDADSAVVFFELHAETGSQSPLVASERFVLRSKSEEERYGEVQQLVELAGAQILDMVEGRFGSQRAYVFINEWRYEALQKQYSAEFELHWQGAFRSRWSDLSGQLLIRADGTEGTFMYLRGSENAEDVWLDKVKQNIIELEPLFDQTDLNTNRKRN